MGQQHPHEQEDGSGDSLYETPRTDYFSLQPRLFFRLSTLFHGPQLMFYDPVPGGITVSLHSWSSPSQTDKYTEIVIEHADVSKSG